MLAQLGQCSRQILRLRRTVLKQLGVMCRVLAELFENWRTIGLLHLGPAAASGICLALLGIFSDFNLGSTIWIVTAITLPPPHHPDHVFPLVTAPRGLTDLRADVPEFAIEPDSPIIPSEPVCLCNAM